MAYDETYEYLGSGVLVPFMRDGIDDFSHGSGLDIIQSSLTIILGTMCAGPTNHGELPWHQELGTLIKLLRHRNINDPTTEELATHYVLNSILKNEPRIRAKEVKFIPKPDENKLVLKLKYDVIKRESTGAEVIQSDVQQEIEL